MESNKPYNELPLLPPDKKVWEKIEVLEKEQAGNEALFVNKNLYNILTE
jgi:hypothetical protein